MAAKHLLLDDLHLQVAQRLAIRFSGHLVFVTLNNTRDGFLGHQVRFFKSSFLPVLPTTPGLCKQELSNSSTGLSFLQVSIPEPS